MLRSMAYTVAHLEALQAALASGELSIRHNGRMVTYRSADELIKAIREIERGLAAQASANRGGIVGRTADFSRGIG